MAKLLHLFRRLGRRDYSPLGADQRAEIEEFLYLEAEILDSWEFERWLELLAPDIRYWAPGRENRPMREMAQEIAEPGGSAHFDEDHGSLTMRVQRLLTDRAWAESPPMRTRHLVSNIRAFPGGIDGEDTITVESSFLLYRSQGETSQDYLVGKRFDVLRRAATPYRYQIARRTIVFDQATLLVKNLSSFY